MPTGEALAAYLSAQKSGLKCRKERILRGEYPYLQVLDDITEGSMAKGKESLGVIDVPIDMIVGTVNAGRRDALAANFMPCLPSDTEFASKWINLCSVTLGDEGIHDPVECFEYLGRFYVEEGNKRVSVLKYFGAATVRGNVTRIVPEWSCDDGIALYYEFMDFYRLSGIYTFSFTKTGSYRKLQAALGHEPEHVWNDKDRSNYSAAAAKFRLAAEDAKLSRENLGDVFLLWLQVYGFDALRDAGRGELTSTIVSVAADAAAQVKDDPISVSTQPAESKSGLVGRLIDSVLLPNHLGVAFISDRQLSDSPWARAHDAGRERLEEHFGNKVTVKSYYPSAKCDPDALFEAAAADGADVIFAVTPSLINCCRRAAAKHKNIRIYNCSVSMPFPGVKTYYSRIYEGKFISGAVAGAMTKSGRVGYVAGSPIFGTPAGINAFALGAKLTCPDVEVVLRWTGCTYDAFGELTEAGCDMISGRDVPTARQDLSNHGLMKVETNGVMTPLLSPVWNWGEFYIKIVQSVFSGSADLQVQDSQALNYWWGLDSGVVDIKCSDGIPVSMAELVDILKRGVSSGALSPFRRRITAKDGRVINDGERWMSPEEILKIDWLEESVDGSIPSFDELLPIAKPIVRLLGIYRDKIPPDKDEIQI